MGKTKIEWCDETWNPFIGCSRKSLGCKNCYAVGIAEWQSNLGREYYDDTFIKRDGKLEWTGVISRAPDHTMEAPLKKGKKGTLIFVCSVSDFFHENASDDLRLEVLDIIQATPRQTYQFLTKRPENILPFLERTGVEFPDHVWVGATVENRRAKKRIGMLRDVPAAHRFISIEPLLEDLGEIDLTTTDWAIVGGESGDNARPMEAGWVRNIQHQCEEADVPFFFKQWGQPVNNPIAETVPPGVDVTTWVEEEDPHSEEGKGGALLDWKLYKENPCRKK
jgi:protein gp37